MILREGTKNAIHVTVSQVNLDLANTIDLECVELRFDVSAFCPVSRTVVEYVDCRIDAVNMHGAYCVDFGEKPDDVYTFDDEGNCHHLCFDEYDEKTYRDITYTMNIYSKGIVKEALRIFANNVSGFDLSFFNDEDKIKAMKLIEFVGDTNDSERKEVYDLNGAIEFIDKRHAE